VTSSASDRPPSSFLRLLPKAELHLHLEGAIEPATLFEIRQRRGERSTRPRSKRSTATKIFRILLSFKNITEHLRTPEDYELVTYRLMQRLKEENVLHAESTSRSESASGASRIRRHLRRTGSRTRPRRSDFGISLLGSSTGSPISAEAAQESFRSLPSAITIAG